MIRSAAAAAALALALLTACRGGDDGWHPEAPFASSLRPAFGARVTDGQLRIWTGSRCAAVTRLALTFEPVRAELVLTAPNDHPAAVEHLTIGGPYPGLDVAEPLPYSFDWRSKDSVRISVYGGTDSWGSTAELAEVKERSAEHPPDTYWFQGVGWLDPADVAAQDGTTFLATCTPDPAKASTASAGAAELDSKRPPAFADESIAAV